MTVRIIDLNCDLGESPARAEGGDDAALLEVVSSANIACGGHAGDERTMSHTIQEAVARGVTIGAHPSFPDRERFGRFELDMPADEIQQSVFEQIMNLHRIATSLGGKLRHVKPHGALYHAAMFRDDVADAVSAAALQINASLQLVGLAGARGLMRWQKQGLPALAEAFADRRYEPDGSLRSRSLKDAVISDPAQAAEQATRIALGRGVVTSDGSVLQLHADTICIHSDTADSLVVAKAVRAGLEAAGFAVKSPAETA